MIGWEAWCYRCRERDSGTETDDATASGKIAEFRHDHQGSCGMAVSIGSWKGEVAALTGDGSPRGGGEGA